MTRLIEYRVCNFPSILFSQVRRLEPLPESLTKQKAISTILAIRVPEEDAEIDRLSAMFKCYGKIQQMRVVLPEKKLPAYLLVSSTIKNMGNHEKKKDRRLGP